MRDECKATPANPGFQMDGAEEQTFVNGPARRMGACYSWG
jgi:hypothetical protein